MDYVIVSDGVVVGNSEILGIMRREYGYITFATASGLSVDDVGKKYTEKIKVYSKDYNYCSGELPFTIEIVDRATPSLSVPEITAVYDGESITNNEIIGSATIEGHRIDGTWSFEGIVPTNVADSGEYDVVFTPAFLEGYKSAKTKITVTISARDIESDNIGLTLENYNFVYNRKEQIPNVNAEMNGKNLIAGTDYTVTYP